MSESKFSFIRGEVAALTDLCRGLATRRSARATVEGLQAKASADARSTSSGEQPEAYTAGYNLMLSIAKVIARVERYRR